MHRWLDNLRTDEALDPDRGKEEYEVWISSKCGRTGSVIFRRPYVKNRIEFSAWRGKTCNVRCLLMNVCRVGSDALYQEPAFPVLVPDVRYAGLIRRGDWLEGQEADLRDVIRHVFNGG